MHDKYIKSRTHSSTSDMMLRLISLPLECEALALDLLKTGLYVIRAPSAINIQPQDSLLGTRTEQFEIINLSFTILVRLRLQT